MSANVEGIPHERVMQAFADLNRMIEQQREKTDSQRPPVDVGQR